MKIYRIETYLNIHFYQDCDCFSFYKQIKEIQKYVVRSSFSISSSNNRSIEH